MYPRTTDPQEMLRRCKPRIRGIYQYWDAKRGARLMPARRDIDPIEMKPWLSAIQLIDIFHNPRRMIYRLVGQVDVEFRGFNPTGRTVEECAVGASLQEALANYDIVITQRSFVYDHADYVSASGFLRGQESILLPLSDDGETVNMVLTYAEVLPITPSP
ncbi:PAS domain-containing protein [Dongia soli]|uniref:PAS domain-containing protein n=1 Tax=Dongia soli TaxID=600628 RepID=A0ABU5EAG7_9PROT|nr:PAS domain-containing protein [Dongia soli]MDY0883348.1 PAS domain-containing protein [Dongia soli]